MSSDTRVPLSSVAEIVSVKVPVSSLGGHPYVSTENLLPNLGGLGEGELPDADRVNSFNKHDTLFSNIRPYFRKVHYAPTEGGCSADVLVFRTKNAKEFWPPYLYYCLADPTFIEHTMATCKGAKMPRGDKGAMLQYLVHKPDLDAQKKVSSLLRNIDESVSALQHQNTALGAIAQRLFRSWFVNFDPVHAKAAGKEPEAMSAELAALFPSEFEDSEQGSIPKGWSRLPVKALCSRVSNGATPSRSKPEFWGEGHGWFKTGELLDGFILKAKEEITPAGLAGSSAKIFPRHSVLMAIYAAPTVGRLGILTEPACFNQAATGMMPKDSVGPWFLYQALKHGRAWFNSRSNGAAQQNISKEIVENYQILTPSTAVLAGFNKVVGPCYQQMELNTVLCHTLSSLRDHLLPRLISGKLSLEEAERSIEEAVDA